MVVSDLAVADGLVMRRAGMSRLNWEPRRLGEGEEPDPRFILANERTFL